MKAEIISASRPPLKPGQLWRKLRGHSAGATYLVTINPVISSKEYLLINTSKFLTYAAHEGGFGTDGKEAYEYIGELTLKED